MVFTDIGIKVYINTISMGNTIFKTNNTMAAAAAIVEYAPELAALALPYIIEYGPKAVKAISSGVAVNKLHRANRKMCGMSKSTYRKLGGYKSRTPLCKRKCYKDYGRC